MVEKRIVQAFVELSDTLVAGFDTIDFLHILTERTVELLAVDVAGVLLADQRGALSLMATSTQQAAMVELFRMQERQGPCVQCYRTGRPVNCDDLTSSGQQWPEVAEAARDRGFAASLTVPMRLHEQIIGTMSLFRATVGAFPEDTVVLARSFADMATIGILQARAIRRQEVVAEQLHTALNTRILIEQAKGMLAERHQIGTTEAFVRLRGYARSHNEPLSKVARMVVDHVPDVADLTFPPG